MKDKVIIESINKITQIDSIEVHANSIICDLKLDVEKVVSAESDKFKDVDSAKSNAYQRAKAEFGIDIIADASYIIRRSIDISTVGWVGIALALVGVGLFFAEQQDIAPVAIIIGVICMLLGIGIFYKVTISGYAGHYINPKDFYNLKKDRMMTAARAAQKIFADTPKLSLEEKKVLELIQSGKIVETNLNSEQLIVWKKQKKIDNKSDQTNVFYSVLNPNHDYNFATPATSAGSVLASKSAGLKSMIPSNLGAMGKSVGSGLGNAGELLKKLVAFALIAVLGFFAYKKYQSFMNEREAEQEMLKMESEQLMDQVATYENAIKAMDQSSVDSLKIAGIAWDYEPEEYEDSVLRYNEIRARLMTDYQAAIGKKLEEERQKNIQILLGSAEEILGTYAGSNSDQNIRIEIISISGPSAADTSTRNSSKGLQVRAKIYQIGENESMNEVITSTKNLFTTVDFKDGKVQFNFKEPGKKSTDGTYVMLFDYNNADNLNGEWISNLNPDVKRSVYLSRYVKQEGFECYDGSIIPLDYVNDGECDCSGCEDEGGE